jgi:exodeoxyribonuclease III
VLKIVSFNVNGMRSRRHQLEAIKAAHDPDILGLQETKVPDEDFPRDMVAELGLEVAFHGQKSHYGVALLSKQAPLQVEKGYPFNESEPQRRAIIASYRTPSGETLKVIDAYFPQGESRDHPTKFRDKREFYSDMLRYLREHASPEQALVLLGDMNVAPLDLDIGIGEDNAKRWLRTGKTSFLPEEREWLQALMDWGLHDSFRGCHPAVADRFSWFDYRSRGFEREPRHGLRIDLLLVTRPLRECLVDAGIDYEIRSMERPSDHCPIWAVFDF